MQILALETSLRHGSVAFAKMGNVVASMRLSPDSRSAQSLAPAVKEMLSQQNCKPSELSAVAVSIGPGSFTGVRVGVSFAKVFCYAANVPILGFTTLEVIASQAIPFEGELHVVLDAQRTELFQQAFRFEAAKWVAISEPRIVGSKKWLSDLADRGDVRLSGPGLAKLAAELKDDVRLISDLEWEPRADSLAQLATAAYDEGRRDDAWKLEPLYLRASAAEEKRLA